MRLIPYQTSELSNRSSFDRWSNLRDEINRISEPPYMAAPFQQRQLLNGWTPALDVYQNTDNVVAVVELPGMRKEEIEISLHDGTLTIAGERKSTSGEREKTERAERFTGKFRRSVTLSTRIDAAKIAATYKDGVLTVTLPKAEEAKPQKIEVSIE